MLLIILVVVVIDFFGKFFDAFLGLLLFHRKISFGYFAPKNMKK